MKATTLWRITGASALLSTALLIGGLGYGVKDVLFPQESQITQAPAAEEQPSGVLAQDRIDIVAFGDSLTKGTGDQTGKGYVGGVKEKLQQATGKPVFVTNNMAINGYQAKQLLNDLETKKPMRDAIGQAHLVLLTIGGNDLFHLGQEELAPETSRARMKETLPTIEKIIDMIAKANPNATVMYVGLYNAFLDLDPDRQASLVVQEWNDSVFQITNRYPNVVFVPTADLFQMQLNKYLYTDHFHPNQAGYERIADRIVQVLN
ncbi:GDSL-type esterase/lipase family protein [Paenibacillus sp. y28]|uniref:GDSL-type esterase/lipase family protein n=1 Tax=Paenibacillus sp. y28 TaxID=3129110 RepID=UPI00301990A7